jgi:hypothetical protein
VPCSSINTDPCLSWPQRRRHSCNCKVQRARSIGTVSFSCRVSRPFDYEVTGNRYRLEDVYVCEKSAPDLLAATRISNLYVTPREDSMRTFCLFFLTPLLVPSSLCPLLLDSDLYTAAMFETVVCRIAQNISVNNFAACD